MFTLNEALKIAGLPQREEPKVLKEWSDPDATIEYVMGVARGGDDLADALDNMKQGDITEEAMLKKIGFADRKALKANIKEINTEASGAGKKARKMAETYTTAYLEGVDGYDVVIFAKEAIKGLKSKKFSLPKDIEKLVNAIEGK